MNKKCILLITILYLLGSITACSQQKNLKDSATPTSFVDKDIEVLNFQESDAEAKVDKSFTNTIYNEMNSNKNLTEVDGKVTQNSEIDIIMNTLNSKMIELDIRAIEPDEINNKVYVYFDLLDELKINKVKEVIDSPCIVFKKMELKLVW